MEAVLIQLVIVLVILGVIWFIIDRFVPIERNIKVIIMIILAVIAIVYLIRVLGALT